MYYDPNGNFPIITMIILGTLLGAAISGGINAGKQLSANDWDFSKVDWGSVANSTIVGGAIGFASAMGVVYLGPAVAAWLAGGVVPAAVANTAGYAFLAVAGVSFTAGALGYATEEWMNGRTPNFTDAMIQGGFVAVEGMINFGIGGLVGGHGNVGTKGMPILRSTEWWWKLILGSMYSKPPQLLLELIRKEILNQRR